MSVVKGKIIESFGGMGVRGRDLVSKIEEEGGLNGVGHIHGMKIKTFLLRALAFTLQNGNADIAIHGSRRVAEDWSQSCRDTL